ncbi:NUDIX domain-containing protein [Micromonospora sp. H61]|uniref:NUDIX hydrolase n=1 Tax=unclassified Micromonospora TaxID=2617518 RepID=UPI001B39C9D5|nr:NUDIX domain-containing protein [Micromonospora sp. H61]MBQ0993015.1 NUDIX domain-containing protein [Micromonospora sp. H61]
MSTVNLRQTARAIIVDDDYRVLLLRLAIPDPAGTIVVWITPGGGVEDGETPLVALRRELHEEVGLAIDADPPQVWRQEVVASGHASGHDGVANDYFLVRTASFTPRGAMSDEELAAEHVTGWRWWSLSEIREHHGPELFSPRDLATPLAALIADGAPTQPVPLGL